MRMYTKLASFPIKYLMMYLVKCLIAMFFGCEATAAAAFNLGAEQRLYVS